MEKTKNKVIFSREDWEDMRNEKALKEAIEIIEDREDLVKAIAETEFFVDYEENSRKRREKANV